MKRCALLLLLVLPAVPAAADDKKKDDKKAQAPVVVDPMKDAEAKLAAGDVEGAIKALEPVAATNGAAALKLGVLREERGELDLAIDAYKAAAGTLAGPGKGEALGRMSVAQDARGMAEAGASADAALAADPQGVWPTIAISYSRVHEGKADEAVALAQKAVAAGGGASATTALAHAQEAKGDMAAAEATYRQAIAADPKALGPVIGLATVLRRTGRAAEAEPMLAKVIEASPGAVPAYKEMARVKIAQGRASDAVADANLAAAMAENDPEAKELVDGGEGRERTPVARGGPGRPGGPGPDAAARREPGLAGGADRARQGAGGAARRPAERSRSCRRRPSSTRRTPTRSTSSATCCCG